MILISSCTKEKFPNLEDLQGTWTQQTENSAKHILIFEPQTMYFIKPDTEDTLVYRLDKNKNLLYLTLKNNPSAGESNHKILLNKKSQILTIFGLFPGVSSQISETKFKK